MPGVAISDLIFKQPIHPSRHSQVCNCAPGDMHLCVGLESIAPGLLFGTERCHSEYGFRARARARPGMTVMGQDITRHPRDTTRPSFAAIISRRVKKEGALLPKEGSRECRVPDAPMVSCKKARGRPTGSPDSARHSLHNGFTVSFVISLVTGLLPPSPARSVLLTNLTPASGRQNHTTSPSASARFVYPRLRVHRLPCPTSVTIAKRPSGGTGWRNMSR